MTSSVYQSVGDPQNFVVVDVDEHAASDHTRKAGVISVRSQHSPQLRPNLHVKDLVHQAIQDAGRWAYGTVLVELWVLNDTKTHLFRPEGGAWFDPVLHMNSSLLRLTNPDHPGYVEPTPLPPGIGLPGVLWAEAATVSIRRTSALMEKRKSVTNNASNRRKVAWRDVNLLVKDPDQPANPRLQVLEEAGLGWAAAVPFNIGNVQGEVVYVAREGVDLRRLQSPNNEAYLAASADLIGSAYVLRSHRLQVVKARKSEVARTKRRVTAKLLASIRLGITLEDLAKPPVDGVIGPTSPEAMVDELSGEFDPAGAGEPNCCDDVVSYAKDKAVSTIAKCKGGSNKPPPPFNFYQTLWTFFGVLMTLLVITRINKHFSTTYGSDFRIILGPFGALMTLQYGLTAAPASQPRNAILGQAVSLTISLLVSMADGIDLYIRQSLATALAVAVMVKLGITHPPAGAAALIFASGSLDWTHMFMMLFGNFIAIACSILWNNLHDKRQYPTYYGVGFVVDWCRQINQDDLKKVE